MKIRTGFVSNSSSSSFVIGKCYMKEDQIKRFAKIIDEAESNSYDGETYAFEDALYFYGKVSNHDSEIDEFIEREGLAAFYSANC